MKKLTLFVMIFFAGHFSRAQQAKAYTENDYARNPVWISMIKDTAVNFFEAEKAYKTYFQHHEKPAGEHDIIGERAKEEKQPGKRELSRLQADDHMRMEIKKYENWRIRMHPYVQPDGTILTPTQRLKIWKDNKK